MFEGQFQLTFDKMDNGKYKINVVATPNGGGDLSMLSEGGQKFYNAFTEVTTNEKYTADFYVANNSDNVDIGSYKWNVMDIGDIQAFPAFDNCSVDQCGPTQAGKIIHETTEQFEKAKRGIPYGSRDKFDPCHAIATDHEDDTNQNIRGKDSSVRQFATQRFTSKITGKTTEWEIVLGRNGRKTFVDPPK